jgi:hypothetical protein
MKLILSFASAAVLTSALFAAPLAYAQDAKPAPAVPVAPTPAPAAASTEKPVDVPKHSCKRPENPGKLASDRQMSQFRKEIDGYRDCLTAYRENMNKTAKAYVEAANGAIQEFNDYVTELNASVKK